MNNIAKVTIFTLAAAATSLVAAGFFSYRLWNYWLSPPVVADINPADEIVAASAITYENHWPWLSRTISSVELQHATGSAKAGRLDLPEQRLLSHLQAPVPEIPPEFIRSAQDLILRAGFTPTNVQPGYRRSADQWYGNVLVVKGRHGVRMIGARHTGETANDRHFYTEAVLQPGLDQFALVRQAGYFFEISGLEGLTIWWLWAGIFLLILITGMCVAAFRAGVRGMQHIQRASTKA
jgi:hypothetical protein